MHQQLCQWDTDQRSCQLAIVPIVVVRIAGFAHESVAADREPVFYNYSALFISQSNPPTTLDAVIVAGIFVHCFEAVPM